MIRNPFHFEAQFRPGVTGPEDGPGYWYMFAGRRLLVRDQGSNRVALPRRRIPRLTATGTQAHFLGELAGQPCFAIDTQAQAQLPDGIVGLDLRELYGRLDGDLFLLGGRAYQILQWDRTHRFCGACGAPTRRDAVQRARICIDCGMAQYPRLTPAMMALVVRERRILLARSPRFPDGMYSALAGFVEPGETLEACVHREVREEVGLEVGNLRYFASQSWPFPHSLMVAYVADHAAGEIRVDGEEVVDAGWFSPEDLPAIPGRLSIAGHLIRTVAARLQDGETW